MSPFRAFVVGTDTGIGKTQVARALLSLLADRGLKPAPFKPYESGVTDHSAPEDARALVEAARSEDPLDLVCPHRFREPLAPGVAAAREGRSVDFARTLGAFHAFDGRPLVAEAAGGLRVPVDDRRDVIDLVVALKLPAVLVARAGLGTLNHTALSLDLLRSRAVPVLAVVLSRTTEQTDPSEQDNAAWIARRHGVTVLGPVPHLIDPRARHEAFRKTLAPLVHPA